MPFTKTYNGAGSGATVGDYSDSRNWELISVRNNLYNWTNSGATPGEYYLRTAANGNPGFAASPPSSNGVYTNGTARTKNTLGSLGSNEWGYGDQDGLGYSTLYLNSGGDPDSQAADYVQFRQIPQTAENVRVPPGASDISSGLDQSAVAIEDFILEPGYDGTVGSLTSHLRIDPNKLEDHSNSVWFIDIANANITCIINNSATADEGEYACNLRGTNIALIDYRTGTFGLAAHPNEVSTFNTLIGGPKSAGGVRLGKGVTATLVTMHGGQLWSHCALTTVNNYNGKLWIMESATVGTLTTWGGEFHYASSGGITTLNLRGGLFNELASSATRTIGTVNKYRGAWNLIRNKEAVTHTTITDQDSYTQSGSVGGY